MRTRDLEFGQEGCGGRTPPCLDLLGVVLRGERLRRGVLVELGGRGGGRSSLVTVGGESGDQSNPVGEKELTLNSSDPKAASSLAKR